MDTPVWTEETIRLVRLAMAFYAMSQRMQEGAHLDDPYEVPPPVEDAWICSVEHFRFLDEEAFPGMEVDEPFLQRFQHLVSVGREIESRG